MIKFLFFVLLWSCADSEKTSETKANNLSLSLKGIRLLQNVPVDSVFLEQFQNGQLVHSETLPWDSVLIWNDVQIDENTSISISIFDDNELRYFWKGPVTSKEDPIELNVVLEPQFAIFEVSLFLGLSNPLKIQSGYLELTNFDSTWVDSITWTEINQGFLLEPLAFDSAYFYSIHLFDSAGIEVLGAEDSLSLLQGEMGKKVVQLNSNGEQVQISISLADIPKQKLEAIFGGASLKNVTDHKDVIISELMSNPKVSGDDWEWIEIYNTTIDSFKLSGCSLAKTKSSISQNTSLILDSSLVIAPGEYLVFGRDSVAFANWKYSSFTLTNSGQSLVLYCQETLIDSLNYLEDKYSESFPVGRGESLELNFSLWNQNDVAASWCAGSSSFFYDTTYIASGSPGVKNNCDN
jgi:hypothetical protein